MKIFKQSFLLLAAALTGYCASVSAQTDYTVPVSNGGNMKLSGTSSLHNWTMNAQTFTGNAAFDFKPGTANRLTAIKALTFNLIVDNLKSKDKGLDKNAYKALKTDQHKSITYSLTSSRISKEVGANYLMETQGALTIAGVTKNVSMMVYCIINNDGTITCKGSKQLKMTDFGVKPPTFLGMMKTGDDITLDFTMLYKK